jgi:DNA invertase Pin-like site-specific DNA recombinase
MAVVEASLRLKSAPSIGSSLIPYFQLLDTFSVEKVAKMASSFVFISMEIKRAFAYMRVSGKGQLEGDGFPRQSAAIHNYAKTNRIELIRSYREEAVSGKSDLEHRPALQDLIEALHADGVRLVLVEKLDRLARDLMIQESIIADFQRNGFEIRSVAEPDLCSDDPSRKLMRQILGAFAEYERQMIVTKLRGARQRRKAKTGRCEGRHPFGMHLGESDTLQRMRELRRQGASYETIARTLDRAGIKPRYAATWSPVVVNRILRVSGRRGSAERRAAGGIQDA